MRLRSTSSSGIETDSHSAKKVFTVFVTVAEHPTICTFFGKRETRDDRASLISFLTSRSTSSNTAARNPFSFSFFKRASSKRRTGLPTAIAGFPFKSSVCLRIGALPASSAHFALEIDTAASLIWEESSSVGATTRIFTPLLSSFSILSASGKRYAKVLPVPVSD